VGRPPTARCNREAAVSPANEHPDDGAGPTRFARTPELTLRRRNARPRWRGPIFVALGGTGYAAFTLPKNSVGTKQLKKNAVTGSKIKSNSVTSGKVKDGSLLAKDFKAGQLPQGAKGDPGAPGAPGAPGTARAYGFVSAGGTLDASVSKNIAAVTHPSTGVYCIATPAGSGIDPSSTLPIADIDAASQNGSKADARKSASNCPAGQFEVDTFQSGVNGSSVLDSFKDEPFEFVIP
jgi:hypothetical protein